MNQPTIEANIDATNAPIGSNGNQGTTKIPMCDNVS